MAEASFRTWLESFLPRRFGVTSGYLVSHKWGTSRHFDVIVYDHLESPVLWVEGTEDQSAQGRFRAIPVEHARAVLEVKVRLNADHGRKAIAKLLELRPFLGQDQVGERYPACLPPSFACGAVFFEMLEEDGKNDAPLRALLPPHGLRGYFGGVVLRGEGWENPDETAHIVVERRAANPDAVTSGIAESLAAATASGEDFPLFSRVALVQGGDRGEGAAALMSWLPGWFSAFAHDLVARLEGRHQRDRLSSLHALPPYDLMPWRSRAARTARPPA